MSYGVTQNKLNSFLKAHQMAFLYVALWVILMGTLGILAGFAMDMIFPKPSTDEVWWVSYLLIITQITLGALLIYAIDVFMLAAHRRDRDLYFEMSIFLLIFYLSQNQLLERLNRLFYTLNGQPLP